MSYFDDNEARFTGIPRGIERAVLSGKARQADRPKRKERSMANEIVDFKSEKGDAVRFTAEDVRQQICPNLDNRELAMVMALCQAQHLNPFTNDVHITKFGDNKATIVTGKEVFTKRAQANPRFEGFEAGITFVKKGVKGAPIERREGSLLLPNEQLIGGWCKVYVKGYRVPIFDEVSFMEYAGRKRDGTLNAMWSSKGATMIRKVALCHALREAFPDDFQGLYGEEEMGVSVSEPMEAANPPSDSEKTASNDVCEPVMEAEFVEAPSEQQTEAVAALVAEFASMKGKGSEDVLAALVASKSMREVGYEGSFDTAEKAEAAIGVLTSWVEKSKAELTENALADEDILF